MTKREIYLTILAELQDIDLGEENLKNVMSVLDKYIKPKKQVFAVDHTRTDKDGNIITIKCLLSGKELPATDKYFKVVTTGGVLVRETRLSLRSLQAEEIFKQFNIQQATKKKEIVLALSNEEADITRLQKELQELNNAQPDYSSIKQ